MSHISSSSIKLTAAVLACVVSFGIGRYLVETPGERSDVRSQMSDVSSELDTLIAFWIAERNSADLAMMSMDENNGTYRYGFFPPHVRDLADTIQQRYGAPSPVTLAQFALESGFGLRHLGAQNYFGHTYPFRHAVPPASFVVRNTREFVKGEWVIQRRRFAAYKNIEHSFDAHGRLLVNVYASALQHKNDPASFARIIARRYATDPDYALKLITIMKRYKLLKGNA